MQYKLEICANSIESALAAEKGGADRIELCDNMAEGGTTPSYGMIRLCKERLSIPVFPIIRPRGGGFTYTTSEFEQMKLDIMACKELGCEGVVLGLLKADGSVDIGRCARLIDIARPMEVTFHRAFDCSADLEKSLEDIIALGCDRILTSGGAGYAVEALDILAALINQAKDRIIIMPGSGINEHNLEVVIKKSHAYEFHSTAKSIIQITSCLDKKVIIGPDIYQTDLNKVILMKKMINNRSFY